MNDKEIIKKLGGVAVVARFLKKKYTTVHNWTTRGIPAKYKLDYPREQLEKRAALNNSSGLYFFND